MRVFHVTETRLLNRIRVQGLRLLQPTNWVNGKGERLGGGALFAFEERADALRWAARMDWGMHCETGTGKISVLTLETDVAWDTDFADTLSQMGSAGRWLKAFQPIPPAAIVATEAFTAAHGRELAERLRHSPSLQKD